MPKNLLPIPAGGKAKSYLKLPGEMTLIRKAGLQGGINDGISDVQQFPGMFKAKLHEIGVRRYPLTTTKETYEVKACAAHQVRDFVKGNLPVEMCRKIVDCCCYLPTVVLLH